MHVVRVPSTIASGCPASALEVTGGPEVASTLPSLRAVARHSLPHVVEATLVPTLVFYLGYVFFDVWVGLLAALAWAYLALARRALFRRRIPGLLVLSVLGLSLRTGLAMATGSTFVYFVQPVLGTAVVAGAFFVSMVSARPLVSRLAADFCPLAPGVASRVGVQRLFRHLTVFWGVINLANAGVTLTLLVTLPLGVFVALKTLTAVGITWGGVVVTVTWSLRVARRERLLGPRLAAFAA